MFSLLEILPVLMAEPAASQTDKGSPVNQALMDAIRVSLGTVPVGTIIYRHDYGGALPAPAKYMKCNGDIINEANYNAGHTTTWDDDIGTSLLDGLYTPAMNNKYMVGVTDTSQDGASALTFEGNADHQIDIQHSHEHNHKWYDGKADGVHDQTFNSAGTAFNLSSNAKTPGFVGINMANSNFGTSIDGHTDKDAINALSAAQSIQPEALATEAWIKIV